MYDIIELNNKTFSDLKEIAQSLNIPKYDDLKRQDLIYKILDTQALIPVKLEIQKEKKPVKRTPVHHPKTNHHRETIKKPVVNEIEMTPLSFDVQENTITADDSLLNLNNNEPTDLLFDLEPSDVGTMFENPVEDIEIEEKEKSDIDLIKEKGDDFIGSENKPLNESEEITQANKEEKEPLKVIKSRERKDEYTFEFDGIVTSQGVLEIMPDGTWSVPAAETTTDSDLMDPMI